MGKSGTVLIISVFWMIYGLISFLGISTKGSKYHGRPFEKDYKKARGIAYLGVGICWLAVSFLFSRFSMSNTVQLIVLIAASLPCMIYSTKQERKYRRMDDELIKQAARASSAEQ